MYAHVIFVVHPSIHTHCCMFISYCQHKEWCLTFISFIDVLNLFLSFSLDTYNQTFARSNRTFHSGPFNDTKGHIWIHTYIHSWRIHACIYNKISFALCIDTGCLRLINLTLHSVSQDQVETYLSPELYSCFNFVQPICVKLISKSHFKQTCSESKHAHIFLLLIEF